MESQGPTTFELLIWGTLICGVLLTIFKFIIPFFTFDPRDDIEKFEQSWQAKPGIHVTTNKVGSRVHSRAVRNDNGTTVTVGEANVSASVFGIKLKASVFVGAVALILWLFLKSCGT